MPDNSVPVVYFDTETGGLDPKECDILTFGAVIVLPGDPKIHEREFKLSLPEYRYNPKALEVNGIDLVELQQDGISPDEFIDSIQKILNISKDTIYVAHNANFDAGYLRETFSRYGRSQDYVDVLRNHIDTKAEVLSATRRGILPKIKTNLKAVCEHFSIDTTGHHGALADSYMCKHVLEKLDYLYIGNPQTY